MGIIDNAFRIFQSAWLGVIIGIISITISLIYIYIQNKKLKHIELERERKIWSQISTTKSLMEDLENNDPTQAIGKVFEQFRFLLKEAVLLEKNYSLKTVKKWRAVGKLSSLWQERQAIQLLRTREIDLEESKELNEAHILWDENAEQSPYNHHTSRLERLNTQLKNDESSSVMKNDE